MAKSKKDTIKQKEAAPKKVASKKSSAKKVAVKKVSAKSQAKKASAKKTATKKVAAKKTVTTKTETKVKKKPVRKLGEGEMLAMLAAQGMFEKKAEQIKILDLRKVPGASADFFVICHATNDKQVEAIAKSVEEEIKKHTGQTPWHREGFTNLHWVLIDYIDVVAHVFLEDKRSFYDLESLWGDAEEIPFKGK
ncbi:MAG: ribosome silencing factor [Bacteroidia bacterium]